MTTPDFSSPEPEAPSLSTMRAFAYRLLGRREYSVRELDQRLRQKFPGSSDIEDLVAALVEENLVSDQRFAESFTRSRVARSQGPLKIRAALRQKGLDDAEISSALSAYDGEWSNLAREWLERQNPGEIDFAAKQKWYRRLCSRGFSHEQAMQAVNPP